MKITPQSENLQRPNPLKPVTTRIYHPGVHGFEPRLNGRTFPQVDFMLHIDNRP